jgi:hypothetical protein
VEDVSDVREKRIPGGCETAGAGLISGNVKAFADDLAKAFGLVQDNAELVQTYEEALDAGKSPQEAFGACMVQAAAEGLWGLTEKQLEQAFLKGFGDWNDSSVAKPSSMELVVYQPPEQDDFLTGFWLDDPPKSGKADFYVSPSGEAIPGEYESYIGDNQRSQILSQIEDQTLRSVVGQMYAKDSVIGTGSLAELVQFSNASGLKIVSKMEYRSAENSMNYINKRLRAGMLPSADKNILDEVIWTWDSALKG